MPLSPPVISMSSSVKPVTFSSKVKVKVTSPLAVCPSRSLVIETVGGIMSGSPPPPPPPPVLVSTCWISCVAIVFPLLAPSCATSAATSTVIGVIDSSSAVTTRV